MDEKSGLIGHILKSAKDAGATPEGKVQRKKITLDDLKRVIDEYVRTSAGLGDPELRSRIVQLELQIATMREQNLSLQKTLESARSGWKAAQEELAAVSKERAGFSGGLEQELSQAKIEALAAHEEASRTRGKLAAAELQLDEARQRLEELKEKAESFAARLDESRRSEKKLKGELRAVEAERAVLLEAHRREVDALQDRILELAAGYDHVDILAPLDWDGALERAKAVAALAGELSVEGPAPRREVLETVASWAGEVRLRIEAEREEEAAKCRAVEDGQADFPVVLRIAEIHRHFDELQRILALLEKICACHRPDEVKA